MKKLTLLGMGAAFALSFASCDKKQQQQPSPANPHSFVTGSKAMVMRHWNGTDCDKTKETCLPDVVVIGHHEDMIAFTQTLNTGTTSDVITLFQNNQPLYSEWFGTELVNGIISGTLTAAVKSNAAMSTNFVIFNQSGATVNVVPLVHD